MKLTNLEMHMDFLEHMADAVENAIARYESSDDADMIELYEMRKEVIEARKAAQKKLAATELSEKADKTGGEHIVAAQVREKYLGNPLPTG